MGENGEIYAAGKNFTLPPALTALTNSNSDLSSRHNSHALVMMMNILKMMTMMVMLIILKRLMMMMIVIISISLQHTAQQPRP